MKFTRSKERLEKYKNEVVSWWNGQYDNHIWRTVHQAGSEQKNIDLAKREIEVFLFPTEENQKKLLEDKEVNPCPTFAPHMHQHKHITEYLPNLGECVALDYGCGSLIRYTTALSKYFKHVIGVDSSPKAVEYSKKYRKDNTTIIQTDGTSLKEIEDNSVDFIFSNLVFQHIGNREVMVDLIQECNRILKVGGVLRANFWDEQKPEAYESPQHGTGFSPEEFEQIFEERNFQIETITHQSPLVWITALKG